MPSVRESAYQALLSTLMAALDVPLTRDNIGPADPSKRFAVLYTGVAEITDQTLGVKHYCFREEAEVQFYLQDPDEPDRNTIIDDFVVQVTEAIAASGRLGGAVDWVEVLPAAIDHEGIEGAAGLAFASLPIALYYQSSSSSG